PIPPPLPYTTLFRSSGFIAVRMGTDRLVYASLGTALLGAAMLWWAPGAAFEVVAPALFGGGLGPLFPTLISLAPSQFGSRAVQRSEETRLNSSHQII